MTMLELVKHLNFAVVVLFTLLYLYQGFYVVVGLVRRRWQDRHQPSRLHRFAVIVSARNEEGVIGELLESLNRQNYPKELLDLYVVPDTWQLVPSRVRGKLRNRASRRNQME